MQILGGLVLLAIGLVVTLATYSSATTSGGMYLVWYGPILFGFVTVVRGLMLRAG